MKAFKIEEFEALETLFPRVLAIMGSPRKKGNTYKLTRKVEEKMKQLGDVEFEYVFLKDLNLKTCLGCRACLDKGEDFCPLKDDRAMLEEKMHNADGVIFVSPTYVLNVTGLMKNFLDRFAYVDHRPRFFKSALLLTTSGGGGPQLMLMQLSIVIQGQGFKIAHSFDVVSNEYPGFGTPVEKVDKKVNKAAKKFYKAVTAGGPKPSIIKMFTFHVGKRNNKNIGPKFYDYHYWKDHGWFEKDAYYYYDPQANIFKKMLAKLLAKLFGGLLIKDK